MLTGGVNGKFRQLLHITWVLSPHLDVKPCNFRIDLNISCLLIWLAGRIALDTIFTEVYGSPTTHKYVTSLDWKENACRHSLYHSSYEVFLHPFRSFCFLNFLVIVNVTWEEVFKFSTKISTLMSKKKQFKHLSHKFIKYLLILAGGLWIKYKSTQISWYNSHMFLTENQISVKLSSFTSYKAIKENILEASTRCISPNIELFYGTPFSSQPSLRICIKWRAPSNKMSLAVLHILVKHNELFRDSFRLQWHFMWK